MKRVPTALATALAAALTLAACGGGGSSDPFSGGQSGPAPSDVLRVGSADFTESALLADIYAGALRAKGVKVERKSLGPRETYIPALKDGSIDLIPEYTGTLLKYLDKEATQTSSEEVYTALKSAVPPPLTVLDKSPAEDKDAVVVTRSTADRYRARSIADLAPHCGEVIFGGPSEFEKRADGLPGIEKKYNCTFKQFKALDTGPITVSALADDTVQAADIFTTNPALVEKGFVALEDPAGNFAAQNVVPLIASAKASAQVRDVLNTISAKLTTPTLIDLQRKVNGPDKPSTAAVAKEWLAQNNLG